MIGAVLGWCLIVIGIVVFAIPGPIGWPGLPVAGLGTILVLRRSRWARRRFVRLSHAHPGTFGRYRRFITGKNRAGS